MKALFLVLACSLFSSLEMSGSMKHPEDKSCVIDKEFASLYKGHLQNVIKNQRKKDRNQSQVYNSISFLELITGIKSQMYYGEHSEYLSKKIFREDKFNWLYWYEENK